MGTCSSLYTEAFSASADDQHLDSLASIVDIPLYISHALLGRNQPLIEAANENLVPYAGFRN